VESDHLLALVIEWVCNEILKRRIVCWRNKFIILFGGFHDPGVGRVQYHSDTWIFNLSSQTWSNLNLPGSPEARSGFSFIATEYCCVLYGGYCALEKASSSRGGSGVKGITYSDVWILHMNEDGPCRWEKVRKGAGVVPTVRSGTTMVHYKNKGVLFGGVRDILDTDEALESECLNDMFQYHVDSNRWFSMGLKSDKPAKKETVQNDDVDMDADEEDAGLEPEGEEIMFPWPRFNASTCMVKNMLYIYGGILETNAVEHCVKGTFWTELIIGRFLVDKW
jgi:hypothetical protein